MLVTLGPGISRPFSLYPVDKLASKANELSSSQTKVPGLFNDYHIVEREQAERVRNEHNSVPCLVNLNQTGTIECFGVVLVPLQVYTSEFISPLFH
jgi:hypothetical protein